MNKTVKHNAENAFEEWVGQFDTESSKYQDMGANEFFIAGYEKANEPMERIRAPHPILAPVGLLLRAMRVITDKTLLEMSQGVGLTPAELSAIECGRTPMSVVTANAITQYFRQMNVELPISLVMRARRATL